MKLKKQKQPDGAGVILYQDFDGSRQLLVMLKPNGKFDIPKGHCDITDLNVFATAQRECWEEVGIFFTKLDLITNEEYFDGKLSVFCAKTDQMPKLKENPDTGEAEHVGWFWVEPHTAINLLPNYLSKAVVWSLQQFE